MAKFKKIELKLAPKTEKKVLPDELKTKALRLALNNGKYTLAQKRFFRRHIVDLLKQVEEKQPIIKKSEFSSREVQIVISQYREIIKLLSPNASPESIEKLVNSWLKNTKKFSLDLVRTLLENEHYLNAIRAINRYCEDHKISISGKFYETAYGFQNGNEIILANLVVNQNGDLIHKTTPAHELIHRLFTRDERKTVIAELYWGLKTELYDYRELMRELKTRTYINASNEAFKLYAMGKKKGWAVADAELRKIMFGKQEKVNYRVR